MTACLLSVPLLGSAATEPAPGELLARAATGPTFYSGESAFRIVPDAVVVSASEARSDDALSRQTRSASPSGEQQGVARIGDYLIILPSASGELKSRARSLSASEKGATAAPYGVAVSESSGAPVLVSPSVSVYATPEVGKALAEKTGGKVNYASRLAERTVIGYDSVDAALEALPALSADKSVNATLDIIETFNEPQ